MTDFFINELNKLKEKHVYRSLNTPKGIDFSSNDYLGLSNHPAIKEAICNALKEGTPVGSAGARLLRGNMPEHIELETFAAKHFGADGALFFSSGFLANYAIFTTLPNRHDCIIFDELMHASARDGINANLAKKIKVKHNDIDSFKKALDKAKSQNPKHIWIAIESVYSMDGDIADFEAIMGLANNDPNIFVIVDEAHSTGIFGQNGKGICEGKDHNQLITLHTCGKGLGVSGALICARKDIIEYMINKSRPFIFTTSESPVIALAVKKSLELTQEESWRREKLFSLIKYANKTYFEVFKEKSDFKSQIIPITMDSNEKAVNAANHLQNEGFDVRAIRPPTVPSARLRISLNANRSEEEILRLFKTLKEFLG